VALQLVLLHVEAQELRADERFPADAAAARRAVRVEHPEVGLEARLLREALFAPGAVKLSRQVDLLVLPQEAGVEEALLARGAVVGSLLRVPEPVFVQVRRMDEALPAVGAGQRLLARVDPDVALEARLLREALGALRAGEELLGHVRLGVLPEAPLLRVDLGVAPEARLLPEALPAVRAGEGLLARVDPEVVPEARLHHEALGALQAGEQPPVRVQRAEVLPEGRLLREAPLTPGTFPGVGLLVFLQEARPAEALLAHGAAVRPRVRELVSDHRRPLGEALPAVGAGERLPARVRRLVDAEHPLVFELLAAHGAAERVLPRADSHVDLQGAHPAAVLPAEPAAVRAVGRAAGAELRSLPRGILSGPCGNEGDKLEITETLFAS